MGFLPFVKGAFPLRPGYLYLNTEVVYALAFLQTREERQQGLDEFLFYNLKTV